MAPMQTGRATGDGAVTDRLIGFYVRRSAVLGLVIVEHCYISAEGRLSFKQLGIHNDEFIGGLEKLASRIHAVGTPVVVQISHAGGVANRVVVGGVPAGPSATRLARELKKNEVDRLVGEFGLAAERAVKAGFGGGELHGGGGFFV